MNKNYDIHAVKVSRPKEHIGKTYDHTGWEYEKGKLLKTQNMTEEHAAAFNEQSHNSLQRVYETPIVTESTEKKTKAK